MAENNFKKNLYGGLLAVTLAAGVYFSDNVKNMAYKAMNEVGLSNSTYSYVDKSGSKSFLVQGSKKTEIIDGQLGDIEYRVKGLENELLTNQEGIKAHSSELVYIGLMAGNIDDSVKQEMAKAVVPYAVSNPDKVKNEIIEISKVGVKLYLDEVGSDELSACRTIASTANDAYGKIKQTIEALGEKAKSFLPK
jgi:hypothetical protein